jgi:hypothetical protein
MFLSAGEFECGWLVYAGVRVLMRGSECAAYVSLGQQRQQRRSRFGCEGLGSGVRVWLIRMCGRVGLGGCGGLTGRLGGLHVSRPAAAAAMTGVWVRGG